MQEYTISNVITFTEWQGLKQYGDLTKGFQKFDPEDLDEICVFYDADMNFLDYIERRKVENIYPAFVLLPRFFWEQHEDTIPDEFMPGLQMQERLKELHTWSRENRFMLESRVLTEVKLCELTKEPREEQVEVLQTMYDHLNDCKNIHGIVQAIPGFGKTAVSIMFAANTRSKTLIVVPNDLLQEQWLQSLLDFTNLKKEDIGIIQGSDLEKNTLEAQKNFVIVKIQSLHSQLKRNKIHNLMEFYKYFNLVFYDEAHTSAGATSYSKTSSIFMTPNLIGLTATPYRDGLNNYLLQVAIGPLIYKADHQNLIPRVEIHSIYVELTDGEKNRLRTIGQDYILFLGMFSSMMKTKKTYFEYLADVVAWNFSQGQNIAILFPTIALMENLRDQLLLRHPDITEDILLLKGKTKADSLEMVKEERKILMKDYKIFKESEDIRVKAKEIKRKDSNILIKEYRSKIDKRIEYLKEHALDLYRKRVHECSIIISNWNLLSAGFSKDHMTNLIIGATPRVGKIPTIQAIGRVTRTFPGKGTPLVQYFIPSCFLDFQKSAPIILRNNIQVQYPTAEINYIGFKKEQQ